ncbi:MAG TPA: dethiobiotin synthase [Planctomycetota bacterium]|nr:dethiobiotin synthase [Planctomycetota bacterium]
MLSMRRGFFITATDTGAGKTVFTAALAARLRAAGRDVVAIKPIASGAVIASGRRFSADAVFLEQAARSGEPAGAINPVLLDAPLAPAVAARLQGQTILPECVAECCRRVAARHEIVLVEGVGGLLVPLTDDCTVADFALMLGLSLIVVARPGLGTINHTALTVECARTRGLRVAGVVISGYPDSPGLAEQTNPAEIQRLTGLPVLAVLPQATGLDVDAGDQGEWSRVVSSIDIARFL